MPNLVSAKTYKTRLEAEVDRSYLHSEGVESYVEADDAGGAEQFPFQPNISGVLLKVSEKDLERASKLLEKVYSK